MNNDKEKIVIINGKKYDVSKLSNEDLIKLANYNKNQLKRKMKSFEKTKNDSDEIER